ncbi:hypothetical protein KC350_g51 [Hortaea werneckii]|nr:hypothetical protein KC350_g51 [Hortaea werneckii]
MRNINLSIDIHRKIITGYSLLFSLCRLLRVMRLATQHHAIPCTKVVNHNNILMRSTQTVAFILLTDPVA